MLYSDSVTDLPAPTHAFAGCFINEGGQHANLEKGESRVIGKDEHFCEEKEGTLQYYAKRASCTKAGKDYKEGEEFTANHLKYKCVNGAVDIVGELEVANKPSELEEKALPLAVSIESALVQSCELNSACLSL